MQTETISVRLAKWAADMRIGTKLFSTEDLPEAFHQAQIHNKWFTKENIITAVNALAEMISDKTAVENWLKKYQKPTSNPKKVLLVLPGNIPAVGFHDILCTLLSGHSAEIKLSSDDKYLIPWMLRTAASYFPEWTGRIHYHEGLINGFDAVIATGSNQSAKTFESYFGTKPNIIRQNRSSIAIIHNSDSEKDLQSLASDVFLYFGLGCRNVSLLFLPRNFDKQKLFDAFLPWNYISFHNAFANNYDYYKGYFSLSNEKPLDGSFYLLRENRSTSAPVAVVHYTEYDDINEVKTLIETYRNQIQCIVSAQQETPDSIKPGQTQSPHIDDYADGVDTMKFLSIIV